MGGVCCSAVNGWQSVKVEAPIEVLWNLILDLDAYPSFLSHVKSIDRHGDQTKCMVGSRYTETRTYPGAKDDFVVQNTVTDMVDGNGARRVLSVAASFKAGPTISENTSTLIVISIDDTTCELVASFAIHLGWLQQFFCRCCLIGQGRMVVRDEIADYAKEAERRYAVEQS